MFARLKMAVKFFFDKSLVVVAEKQIENKNAALKNAFETLDLYQQALTSAVNLRKGVLPSGRNYKTSLINDVVFVVEA